MICEKGSGFLRAGVLLAILSVVGGCADFHPSTSVPSVHRRLAEPRTLRVVTYNVYDTPLESNYRPQRMAAIGEELCRLDPDIVALQEAFYAEDRDILLQALSRGSRLKYHCYYRSGVVGSGLLICSAWPVRETAFRPFSVSNPWYRVGGPENEGDWWAGKGVALARIELPGGDWLDVYDIHAQAVYSCHSYEEVRLQQMTELAAFVNETVSPRAPALVMGDFNCRRGSPQYRAAVDGAHLVRLMKLSTNIDHIFAVSNSGYAFETLSTAAIQKKITVKGKEVNMSDHKGYLSVVRISPRGASTLPTSGPK